MKRSWKVYYWPQFHSDETECDTEELHEVTEEEMNELANRVCHERGYHSYSYVELTSAS